ncbi:hypothetical protein NEUTE2DRAFT_130060 [Neurospora tetrasperma FGSC 2509]|nr:hypothetical protein NEUTE2DRAFT_130060 [Neurospora tetrasperma FGSC 2509]
MVVHHLGTLHDTTYYYHLEQLYNSRVSWPATRQGDVDEELPPVSSRSQSRRNCRRFRELAADSVPQDWGHGFSQCVEFREFGSSNNLMYKDGMMGFGLKPYLFLLDLDH